LPFTVTGGGTFTNPEVGQVIDVVDDEGLECHLLPGGPGVQYLTLVYSASTVGAARQPYRLTALTSAGVIPPVVQAAGQPAPAVTGFEDLTNRQVAWDEHVRTLDRDLIRARPPRSTGPAAVSAAAAPPV